MLNLKSRAAGGVRWTSLNTACTTALQFIRLAILARLLGPKAYGFMAMVMVVIGFAEVFAEMGLSTAIIQRKNPTRNQLSSLYWVIVATGLLIYLVIYLATPLIASGFGIPALKPLLRVAALSFVISPFGAQFQTLLRKALRFDVVTKISIASAIISAGVAISCALMGLGVWSLVWGSLVNTVTRTGQFIFMGWRMGNLPRLHFQWADTQGYLSFGLYRVGAMAANQFNSRVDQLVIGVLLGPVALGYYNMAFRLVMQPIEKMNPILTQVAFPVFSIIQDDTARLKRGFLKMIGFLMSVNAPALIGLAVVAPLAVPLLVGKKWMPSVPLLQVLAFYSLVRSLGNAGGSLIIAKGKANWTLYWNIALTLLIPPVVYLAGLGGEIIHIALALVGMQIILFLCHYRVFIRNLIGPCFSEYLHVIGRPIILAFAMSASILTCSFFIPALLTTTKLFVQVSIGALTYLTFCWFFQRKLFIEIIKLFPIDFWLKKFIKQSG